MRRPFQEFLHPPEVKGAAKRRYWIAVGGWFFLVMLMFGLVGALLYLAVTSMEARYGTEALRPYEMWLLGTLLISLVGAVFLGDYLWGLLFVRTGYLSREAVIRIRTNRAPTTRGERMHRWISLGLSLMIPAALAWVGWYLESWWMMALMFLLGVWLLLSIWGGWKNADSISAGNLEPPADMEKRVMHGLDNLTSGQSKEGSSESQNKPDE